MRAERRGGRRFWVQGWEGEKLTNQRTHASKASKQQLRQQRTSSSRWTGKNTPETKTTAEADGQRSSKADGSALARMEAADGHDGARWGTPWGPRQGMESREPIRARELGASQRQCPSNSRIAVGDDDTVCGAGAGAVEAKTVNMAGQGGSQVFRGQL